MIPDPAACFALMDRYGMLDNIRRHSLVVARIAWLLARRLQAAGVGVDVDLAVAGALLHDIAKTPCLDGRCAHDRVGAAICRKHGYHLLAPIVAEHVVLDHPAPWERLSEREVVYYADKRVNHEEIVPLEARLAYILERYGNGDGAIHQRIHDNFRICQRLEAELCGRAGIAPAAVAELVAAMPASWPGEAAAVWERLRDGGVEQRP